MRIIGFLIQIHKQTQNLDIKKPGTLCQASLDVERSSQLSNQIVKDFKEIADLTYLIPMMEGENQVNTPLDKEA